MKLSPFFAALFLTLPALAQSPAPLDSSFGESVDVRVVNVDVTVTDRDGRPVLGLRREDFEVLEDGSPVELVNFSEITEDTAPAPAPEVASAPPVEASVQEEASKPTRPPLHLVVYVDNANLRPLTRSRVLRQLRGFLESSVGPTDRLMLVTNDLGLRVRRPFSNGTAGLEEDLRELSRLATRGPLQDVSMRRIIERIHNDGCEPEVVDEVRAYVGGIYNDTAFTLSSLQGFVESLAEIDGRKAVVYVSDGLPLYAGDEALRLLAQVCGASGPANKVVGGLNDLSPRLRRLTTTANASRVTFYTLEARGLRPSTSSSVDYAQSILSPEMDFANTANQQDVLFALAEETGGRAVLNANVLTPDLTKIASDLSSYYSLGYTPQRSKVGRVHDIKVRVKRQGVQARHRTTYRDVSFEERLQGRVQAALLHGSEENPLGVSVEIGSGQKKGKDRWMVPVRLRMPADRLALLPQGDVAEGKLRVLVGVRDATGRTAPILQVEVPLRVPEVERAATPGRPFVYELRLEMRTGEQVIAIGVHDEIGRSGSFLVRGIRVDKAGARLDPDAMR